MYGTGFCLSSGQRVQLCLHGQVQEQSDLPRIFTDPSQLLMAAIQLLYVKGFLKGEKKTVFNRMTYMHGTEESVLQDQCNGFSNLILTHLKCGETP